LSLGVKILLSISRTSNQALVFVTQFCYQREGEFVQWVDVWSNYTCHLDNDS